jgi:molybdopterin synthase sulfur carrier subunit
MSVKVRIPSPLRNYTNGQDIVETDGATIGAVLNGLKDKATGIETRLFKAPNQLNRFVNVYLNDEDIRFLQNLDTPVKAGDEISIVPAIAGGSQKAEGGRRKEGAER